MGCMGLMVVGVLFEQKKNIQPGIKNWENSSRDQTCFPVGCLVILVQANINTGISHPNKIITQAALTGYSVTNNKSVSCISRYTTACWYMIEHRTFCVLSAYTWTWISAFLVNASPVSRTVTIYDTLRSTFPVRISLIFWVAGASSVIATSVSSARIWYARISYFRCYKQVLWIKFQTVLRMITYEEEVEECKLQKRPQYSLVDTRTQGCDF